MTFTTRIVAIYADFKHKSILSTSKNRKGLTTVLFVVP